MAGAVKVSIPQLLKRMESPNLLAELDTDYINSITRRCLEDLETDEQSRSEWMEKNQDFLDLAMQIAEEKNTPWEGAANYVSPLLTVAALQFHARAYPAIAKGNQVVKCQITGEDPTGVKEQKAKRIEKHMSYQLLEEMPEWEEDVDKMLLALPILGTMFKKTYFSKHDGRNESKLIFPHNFVVNYKAQSLLTVPRKSELFPLYPQEIIERQMQGLYNPDVEINFGTDIDTEFPQEMVEQHCLIDLDEDGYKEPYIITIHKESQKALRLVANYDKDTIFIKDNDNIVKLSDIEQKAQEIYQQQIQAAQQSMQLAQTKGIQMDMPQIQKPEINYENLQLGKLEPVQYYTKFVFIPSPDGGFYGIGFGWLLYNILHVINTTTNQLLDAGTASNMLAGFVSKGLITDKKGDTKFSIGEFKPVENLTSGSIRDAIYQLTFQPPSPVLFTLLKMMTDAATDITSVKDIMVGESADRETATTTMNKLEQGMKVFTAIYKRIYRSLKEEFKKLKRLNKLYLPVQTYFRILDSGIIAQTGLTDYQGDDTDVQPIADPSIVSTSMRLAKAQMIKQLSVGNPLYNPYNVERRVLEAMEVDNIDQLLTNKQPPPNPKMLEATAKVEEIGARIKKMEDERNLLHTQAVKNIVDADSKIAETDLAKLNMKIEGIERILEAFNAGQGRDAGMEGAAKHTESNAAPSGNPAGAGAPNQPGSNNIPGIGGADQPANM